MTVWWCPECRTATGYAGKHWDLRGTDPSRLLLSTNPCGGTPIDLLDERDWLRTQLDERAKWQEERDAIYDWLVSIGPGVGVDLIVALMPEWMLRGLAAACHRQWPEESVEVHYDLLVADREQEAV
jgi:hypothetical protein